MITHSLNFKYTPQQGSSTLVCNHLDSGDSHTYTWLTNPLTNARNDYAMVTKVAGKNHNSYLLFMSEHDFGNLGTIKYFTDKEKLKNLYQEINSNYFECLFEVTGVIRTDFSTDLIHFNKLSSNFEINLELE